MLAIPIHRCYHINVSRNHPYSSAFFTPGAAGIGDFMVEGSKESNLAWDEIIRISKTEETGGVVFIYRRLDKNDGPEKDSAAFFSNKMNGQEVLSVIGLFIKNFANALEDENARTAFQSAVHALCHADFIFDGKDI